MEISVEQAFINTATIEIKALTVNGRQVTQALFKQLLNEPVVAWDTGEFLGTVWGRVNYFWGDCKAADHLHVVWQLGDQLRRSCVWGKPRFDPWWESREKAQLNLHKYAHLFVAVQAYYGGANIEVGTDGRSRSFVHLDLAPGRKYNVYLRPDASGDTWFGDLNQSPYCHCKSHGAYKKRLPDLAYFLEHDFAKEREPKRISAAWVDGNPTYETQEVADARTDEQFENSRHQISEQVANYLGHNWVTEYSPDGAGELLNTAVQYFDQVATYEKLFADLKLAFEARSIEITTIYPHLFISV